MINFTQHFAIAQPPHNTVRTFRSDKSSVPDDSVGENGTKHDALYGSVAARRVVVTLLELAAGHERYGYRRLTVLLRTEAWKVPSTCTSV